jgi:hypothetical protein
MPYREILYRLYHDLEMLYGDYRDANTHNLDLGRRTMVIPLLLCAGTAAMTTGIPFGDLVEPDPPERR